ncbi:unnamed protein product [Lactuca saligna]|uniref:Uncharacterized protein n=1 Tax=Lactuca saligna TaxID=75948 RepID=A0AA36A4Q3_LACSI|nr:unnamed protein product [Lactuca saligna]
MEFATAQSAFFLTVGACCIRRLKSVAVKLRVNERGLQQHVVSLESSMESSRQQLELLTDKKMTLEECCAHVDAKLDDTFQQNEALSIQVESLEKELLDKEKLRLDREAELSRLRNDLGWLVRDGIVRIVDKVIELPYFLQGVGRIKNICFAIGDEYGKEMLRKAVFVGAFDPNVVPPRAIWRRWLMRLIRSSLVIIYASMMKLDSQDIGGLRQL